MTRIIVTETTQSNYGPTETTVAGWFDSDKATWVKSGTRWDGNNIVSIATGSQWVDEYAIRTASGRWVLNRDAHRYHNGRETYEYISADEARAWMIRCEVDDATIEQHFPAVEEEVAVGRPEVGPQVVVRMSEELRSQVDAAAQSADLTRAAWVRQALDRALTVTKSATALALIGAALWSASDDYVDLDTPCDTACQARMKSSADAYGARIVSEQVATLSRGATCIDAQPTTVPNFLLVQGAALGSQRVVSRMTVDQVFAAAKSATKADDVWVIRACFVKK